MYFGTSYLAEFTVKALNAIFIYRTVLVQLPNPPPTQGWTSGGHGLRMQLHAGITLGLAALLPCR